MIETIAMSNKMKESYTALIAQCDKKLSDLEAQLKTEKNDATQRGIARNILRITKRRMRYEKQLFELCRQR